MLRGKGGRGRSWPAGALEARPFPDQPQVPRGLWFLCLYGCREVIATLRLQDLRETVFWARDRS